MHNLGVLGPKGDGRGRGRSQEGNDNLSEGIARFLSEEKDWVGDFPRASSLEKKFGLSKRALG